MIDEGFEDIVVDRSGGGRVVGIRVYTSTGEAGRGVVLVDERGKLLCGDDAGANVTVRMTDASSNPPAGLSSSSSSQSSGRRRGGDDGSSATASIGGYQRTPSPSRRRRRLGGGSNPTHRGLEVSGSSDRAGRSRGHPRRSRASSSSSSSPRCPSGTMMGWTSIPTKTEVMECNRHHSFHGGGLR